MYQRWLEVSKRGEANGVVLSDLSTAYDLVNHKYLIQKLRAHNLSGDLLESIIT